MEYEEFPEDEYRQRLERLQAALRHENVDYGLFCSEQNYRYVTGHHTETWLNPTRPMAVWVPAEGAPVAVVCESEIEWFRQTSWIERAATYDGLSVGPDLALGVPEIGFEPKIPDAIIDAARMVGVTPGKRVGWEFGSRSRMNMPQMVIQGVQSGLEGVEWVDAASLMWGVRAIKSEREVECLRVAVKSLDGAFEGILQNLPSGLSERDVARKLKIGVMQHGADRPGYVNVVGDVGSYPVFSAPTTRSLREGCLMYIDGGSVYRGYWSDYCRMMAIGRASDAQKTAYGISYNAMEAAIVAARPGNSAGDIARAVREVVESETGPTETGIGRVGHGIGLEMPEPPSLHPEDETVLRPGMVLCLEPNLELPGVGFLVAEEQVVITEDGCELLSRRAPAELPVV